MTNYEIYVRLLTELNYGDQNQAAIHARLKLQDVLIDLREKAAEERGDPAGWDTQDSAESDALRARRLPKYE